MTRIALVTGAVRGIGREIAAGLAAEGITTIVAARDGVRGAAVATELSTGAAPVSAVQLDVTDDASVARAAAAIGETHGRLDILVNNAGVLLDKNVPPSQLPVPVLLRTFDVNVFGVVRVTNALLPLLRRSDSATVVNVSSAMGSLTLATSPDYEYYDLLQAAYNASKSAANALTIQYAKELEGSSVAVLSVHPGVCATDLNNQTGPRTAAEGAAVVVAAALQTPISGTFLGEGGPLPW